MKKKRSNDSRQRSDRAYKLIMMRKRRNQNKLPNAKDQRISELEQKLSQALAINERLQKQMELLRERVEELERPIGDIVED